MKRKHSYVARIGVQSLFAPRVSTILAHAFRDLGDAEEVIAQPERRRSLFQVLWTEIIRYFLNSS